MSTENIAQLLKRSQAGRRMMRGNLKSVPMALRGGTRKREEGWFTPTLPKSYGFARGLRRAIEAGQKLGKKLTRATP